MLPPSPRFRIRRSIPTFSPTPPFARGASLLLLLALACSGPTEGRVEALGTGDIIDEPLARMSPDFAPCGEPVAPSGQLARWPYLQSTLDTSASILWVSVGSPERLVVVEQEDGGAFRAEIGAEDRPSRYAGGTLRRAQLDGLQPGTSYCYSVLADDGTLLFGPAQLRTAPMADDETPVQVLVFGDSGDGGTDQLTLAEQMTLVQGDTILHTGDAVYPSGSGGGIEQYVFGVYRSLFSSRTFFPSLGNHDVGTSNGAPFLEAYELPGSATGSERYYAFDNGAAHFVALDTTQLDEAQAAWLDADLARNRQPWTIVYGHHPAKSSGMHGDTPSMNRLIVPILERHGVDLALAGHDHNYERFQPLNGVTYIVTGAGGKSTREVIPGPDTAFAEDVTHFLAMSIEASTLRVWAVDGIGRVFDSLEMVK